MTTSSGAIDMTDPPPRRRAKSISPTQRSLAFMRGLGFTCQVVERWNQFAHVRQDLYGFCDLLAMLPGCGILAIQVCADASAAARRDKIIAEPRARTWLESGGRIELHRWGKHGERGKRKLWQLTREDIGLEQMGAA